MQALIVNHLWQSTLFALGIGLLTLLFRNNGAHVRYWLWWAASLKFLLPFSLMSAVGASVAIAPSETLRAMTVYPPLQRLAAPVGESAGPSFLMGALVALWAVGVIAVLAHWGRHALHLHRVRRAARPAPRRVQDSLPGLPVLYTASPLEPGLVGVLRPALLLPEGIDRRLSPDQMRAVFGHELAHWRRRDNITGAVHMLVAALFWFHPLVWWIGKCLVHERERACDEAVMAAGHDADTYAEGILNVCHFYVASKLACAPGVSGADLKARISTIMTERTLVKLNTPKKLALALCAAGMIALPIAAGAAAEEEGHVVAHEQALMPVHREPATYPKEALEQKTEGHVVLEFTVDKTGKPKDIKVVESKVMPAPAAPDAPGQPAAPAAPPSPDVFNETSIEAIKKFQFAPSMRDGHAVERKNVRFMFKFQLAKDEHARLLDQQIRQAHEQVAQAARQLAEAQKNLVHLTQQQRLVAMNWDADKMARVREQVARAEHQLAAHREEIAKVQQRMKTLKLEKTE